MRESTILELKEKLRTNSLGKQGRKIADGKVYTLPKALKGRKSLMVLLEVIKGKSYEEIAAAFDLSISQAYMLTKHAMWLVGLDGEYYIRIDDIRKQARPITGLIKRLIVEIDLLTKRHWTPEEYYHAMEVDTVLLNTHAIRQLKEWANTFTTTF